MVRRAFDRRAIVKSNPDNFIRRVLMPCDYIAQHHVARIVERPHLNGHALAHNPVNRDQAALSPHASTDREAPLPALGHVAGTEAGDLAAERDGIDAAGLLAVVDDVPALLRLGVVGDGQRPQLLKLLGLDDLAGRLAVQQRQVVRVADVQEARPRVDRKAPGNQVDRHDLGLRRPRRDVDDDVLQFAVDDALHRVADQAMVPIDAEVDPLPVSKKRLGEM